MARKYKYLTHEERLEIERRYKSGERPADIANGLGIHTATIYRELQKGFSAQRDVNHRNEYSAEQAQKVFVRNIRNRGCKVISEKKRNGVHNDSI